MNKLISECYNFFKDCGFQYAICGGHALELFLNKEIRTHSDVDITVFEDDKKSLVEFILSKGWNVYKFNVKEGWLERINNSDDEKHTNLVLSGL